MSIRIHTFIGALAAGNGFAIVSTKSASGLVHRSSGMVLSTIRKKFSPWLGILIMGLGNSHSRTRRGQLFEMCDGVEWDIEQSILTFYLHRDEIHSSLHHLPRNLFTAKQKQMNLLAYKRIQDVFHSF